MLQRHASQPPSFVGKATNVITFVVVVGGSGGGGDVYGNSLLSNSMIVYGSGNSDANRHTHEDLPIVLAGGGGGAFTPGRVVKHGSKPMSNLFLTMADRMGIADLERFGDSTGRLDNI